MELSKRLKVLLGIATMWPPMYILLFLIGMVGFVLLTSGGGNGPGPADPFIGAGFLLFFVVHMLTILLSLGLTVFYIVHAIKNDGLKNDMKAMWAVLFFFVGMFAQPVYWYMQIWKEPSATVSQLQPPPAFSWSNSTETRQEQYVPPNEPPDWR